MEEGEITLKVKHAAGSTRFERIVKMIEDSEKLKSSVEGKAANLADALVPWSLGGTPLHGFDTQFHKGTVDSYGGFFLCIKAGNAVIRSFCYA